MDARPLTDTVDTAEPPACTDLKTLLRSVKFPISRRELHSLAARSGLDRGTIAALGTLTEERYECSFNILRELRHHGGLRQTA